MEFSIKTGSADKVRSGCIVVGVFEPRKLTAQAEAIDAAANKYLTRMVQRGDMEGKSGTTLLLHQVPNVAAERVLLVGLGSEEELHEKEYRDAVRTAVKALHNTGAGDAVFCLHELSLPKRDAEWKIEHAVSVAMDSLYRFDKFKSTAERSKLKQRKIAFLVSGREQVAPGEQAVARALAVAHGVDLAKDLGNLPPNVCTPAYLAQQGRELAKSHGLKVEVLEQKDMEKLGMGSLLAVARGSRQPPKMIVLHYQGAKKAAKPVVLVGKGITFDSGGISIKPSAEMDEMKYDMCGAASVLGTLQAIAEMKLPLNVVGVIPTCENMPDGNASRPGDVVISMSGQSIEILNTDAEGRLILCDALTYSERFEPAAVIDMATLTGACVIALGHVASGLFSNDDELADELAQAGDSAHDRAWQMPLWDDYQEQLRSNFADMANIGGRPGGSITAACFLSRFAKKFPWAHLDIAGTAWKSGKDKGSTGRPVGLLTRFLIGRADRSQ